MIKNSKILNINFHNKINIIHGIEGKTAFLKSIINESKSEGIEDIDTHYFTKKYPNSLFNYLYNKSFLTVLINIVENNLHPKLQHKFFNKLTSIPNIQFIVTTNSPHIINCKKDCFVYHIKENNFSKEIVVERQYKTYGQDINSVLTNLMGLEYTRPSEIHSKLHRIYKMIDDNTLTKVLTEIKILEKLIGNDYELIKAKTLIKRKELIGK